MWGSGSASTLALFFALAFGWSWAFWLGAALVRGPSPVTASVLQVLGGFGPSLAAVMVVAHTGGRSGQKIWLTRCLQWRVGWRWMLLAVVLPALGMGLAVLIPTALGGTLPDSPARGHPMLAAINFVPVCLIGGPLGEEFGWRGHALPAMQARWGWRSASLLLGGVWAAWHLPLFYCNDTVQSHLPLGLYATSIVASSVVFAWLYRQTRGSVLPALILHTAINAWPLVIPVMALPAGNGHASALQWVVGMQVALAIGLLMPDWPRFNRYQFKLNKK